MPTSDETQEAPATDVVEAWRRVLRDMPAVHKDNRMSEGGGYNFRSIEQFTGHASMLVARHGVVVFPVAQEIEYLEVGQTRSGATIIEARGRWDWLICGPGGPEDRIMASSFGQGRDSSDKAANKAATAAFKYLLMPALMISDRKDDPDTERIETEPAPAEPVDQEKVDRFNALVQIAKDLKGLSGAEGPETLALLEAVGGKKLSDVQAWIWNDMDGAEEKLGGWVTAAKQRQAAEEPQDEPVEPEKPKRTRTKPGSAVQDAAAKVAEAFPGAEEVADEGTPG